jgi:starvation-inducible DNA-binding protein
MTDQTASLGAPDTSTVSLGPEAAEFETVTGLGSKSSARCADAISRVLADSFQLFVKTQGVHWNVAGPSFHGLHHLTEEQYEDLFEAIDTIAERIRALGHKTPASYTTYLQLASIRDEDRPQTAEAMVAMLVRDNGLLCRTLRAAIEVAESAKDVVSADLLTERLARHESNAWMLHMHVAE